MMWLRPAPRNEWPAVLHRFVRVKLGIVADIHGNDVALRAVLKDAERLEVDRWWVLGDLVLFGPRPVDVLELLLGLPGIGMLRGNTDRYVLTGEQPAPHATAADAAGNIDLVERYAAMAAGIAWTRGVLDQADLLDVLTGLPAHLRVALPRGTSNPGRPCVTWSRRRPRHRPGHQRSATLATTRRIWRRRRYRRPHSPRRRPSCRQYPGPQP